jgi:Ni,Fe-hydrogenase III component G
MLEIKKMDNFASLVDALSKYQTSEYVGSFLREVDSKNDEFFVVVKKEGKTHVYSVISDNQVALPDLSKLFYAAHLYQNEIYDFYGRTTENFANHTLRLHTHPKSFFPLRKLGKSMIKERQDFIFTTINGE